MAPNLRFGLVVFGDELLSGKRQDAHTPRLIELLAARGLELDWARCVRDERLQQAAAIRQAAASGDVVILCGGIGATPDDHTRQAAALALGRPLLAHAGAQALIRQRAAEMAAEQGQALPEDSHPDMRRRLEMGLLPAGAELIPNPYNRIPGFTLGRLHFLPGFPVMAHPMMEWLLDGLYAAQQRAPRVRERSFVVQGAFEAQLTPLMEAVETDHAPVKVFSLPSVDHPQWGRCIELGVKGAEPARLEAAQAALREGLVQFGARICTELVR